MARKTRSVTVIRAAAPKRRRSFMRRNGKGHKLSLSVLAGLSSGVAYAFFPGGGTAFPDSPRQFFERISLAYFGYVPYQRRFDFGYLQHGLVPLLIGIAFHGVANFTGINKQMSKLRWPVEI